MVSAKAFERAVVSVVVERTTPRELLEVPDHKPLGLCRTQDLLEASGKGLPLTGLAARSRWLCWPHPYLPVTQLSSLQTKVILPFHTGGSRMSLEQTQ